MLREQVRKKVLLTGGSGFVGARLTERLLMAGHEVVVLTRQSGTPSRLLRLTGFDDFQIRQCDPLDAQQLFLCFSAERPDIVYHLAAQPDASEDFKQIRQVIDGNISLTVNLLEACRRYPVSLFVYTDSSKVYGNQPVPYRADTLPAPVCSYAIAKLAGWNFCEFYRQHHGVPSVSVRPTLIYGPGQGYNLINFVVESIIKGRHEITLMGGKQTRDPLFIDDAVELFLGLLAVPDMVNGQVINIGAGREYSIIEIATRIALCLRVSIRVKADESQVRPTEIWRSCSHSEEARALLGWQPEVNLEQGLQRTIESLLASPVNLSVVSG